MRFLIKLSIVLLLAITIFFAITVFGGGQFCIGTARDNDRNGIPENCIVSS